MSAYLQLTIPLGLKYLLVLLCLINLVGAPKTKNNPGQKQASKNPKANKPVTTAQPSSSKTTFSQDFRFDYVVLSLDWSPGFCLTSPEACVRGSLSHLVIHGMWPTQKRSYKPAYCDFEKVFQVGRLAALQSDLEKYWFTHFKSSSKEQFWSHEWTKHGTCARDIPELHGHELYFRKTLELAKDLPILETLAKKAIEPDDKKVYSSADVHKALEPITGGKAVQINCDLQLQQPVPVVTGVNFCYDKDLLYVDCPAMRLRCRNNLIWPATFAGSPTVQSVI